MRVFKLSSLCLIPILLGGCDAKSPGDDSADGGADDTAYDTGGVDADALGEEARALVTESLSDLAAGVGMVLNFSHDSELGFANPALGTQDISGGIASMMFPCEEPVQYDHWCDPSGAEGALGELDSCTRFSCVEPGVWGSEAWWAAPGAADPAAPHALSLQAEVGEIRWQAAPLALWRIQDSGETLQVEGEPQAEVEVALASGETLDLSYTGAASAARQETGELTRFELSLDFLGFGDGERALAAQVELGGDGHLTGAVTRGGAVIGTVSQGETELFVEWSQD